MSESTDLRDALGTVRDQGKRGTCLAFAVTAAHEQARRHRRGRLEAELGEELLYWACKEVEGNDSPGIHPSSAAAALVEPGQSAAALWEYDPDRPEPSGSYEPPPDSLAAEAMRHGTLVATAAEPDNLRELLLGGQAVVLVLELWKQFYERHAGELVTPDAGGLLGVAHAVALVGFDDEDKTFLIRNSWGDRWGDSGYARLPYGVLPIAGRGAWITEDDVDP
jgi:hypothetical protein